VSLKRLYVLLDAFSKKAEIQNPVLKHNMKSFECLNSQIIIIFLKSAVLEAHFLTRFEIREEVSD